MLLRNLKVPRSNPFYNENVIKVGNDEYIAQGLDTDTIFSLEELRNEVARESYSYDDFVDFEEYKNKNVFVAEIEIYGAVSNYLKKTK